MTTQTRTIHLMGTVITLTVTHDDPEPILATCAARLKIYEHRFSANDAASELMQVNRFAGQHGVQVHPELYDLIKLGKFYSRLPDGNLNIAIGPLVKTWHIGFADARVPSHAEIQTALAKIDPNNIQLDDAVHQVFLLQAGMEIDLGALAKGYIGDLLVRYLKKVGVTSALLNLGGNVIAIGQNPSHTDQAWHVGIQDPKLPLGNYKLVIPVVNRSVVTSGIYERQLVTQSGTYHHILDRHTGYPIETNVTSLTILSNQSVTGEIWTTELFGKPVATILKTVSLLSDVDAIVITQSGQVYDTRTKTTMIE
ncbi:FAD:protein FMN transferase [Lactobacillus sp. CC-MHH1034]|uniref:FAD:protein FMN transferase n=1 Tax=Agrilactobacillus fermenti TaxID=2586909 RepID=UPI001E3E3E9B|nr:FAD:protein FMN transferase [Agrilactobacillus fermenti]MCD2255196.1 FAD:protein FMN transferase [Agrilactobacillus fermenti]